VMRELCYPLAQRIKVPVMQQLMGVRWRTSVQEQREVQALLGFRRDLVYCRARQLIFWQLSNKNVTDDLSCKIIGSHWSPGSWLCSA